MSCTCKTEATAEEARILVEEVGSSPEKSIPLLQKVQEKHGYLPADLLEAVAKESGIPLAELYGVATFYSQFRFTPRGKYLVRVCKGTACHVAGAEILFNSFSEELGIGEGETDKDLLFSLESVACLGCCSLAPVFTVNQDIYGKMSAAKAVKLLKEYARGGHD